MESCQSLADEDKPDVLPMPPFSPRLKLGSFSWDVLMIICLIEIMNHNVFVIQGSNVRREVNQTSDPTRSSRREKGVMIRIHNVQKGKDGGGVPTLEEAFSV